MPKHPRILGLELHVSSHHQRWWELAKPGSLAVFIWKMINHWDFGGSTRASKQHRLQMMHQQDTADLFPKIFMVSEVISKTASSWIQLTYGIMGQFWWTRNQNPKSHVPADWLRAFRPHQIRQGQQPNAPRFKPHKNPWNSTIKNAHQNVRWMTTKNRSLSECNHKFFFFLSPCTRCWHPQQKQKRCLGTRA